MTYKLQYGTYNPGQYPEVMDDIQALVDDGWRPFACQLNYGEISILWVLDKPDEEQPPAPAGPAAPAEETPPQ